jgi:hypothetical protein
MVGELLSEGSVADGSDEALGAAGAVALGEALDGEGAVCAKARPPNVMLARARTSS